MTSTRPDLEGLGTYKFGWADSDVAGANARRGLNEDVVRDISAKKDEPAWMLKLRLKGLGLFYKKPMPTWGSDLSGIDFDNIKYFVRSTEKQADSWDDLPDDIKNTYDRLGIPEAEKQRLIAGVAAQYECLHPATRIYTANRGMVAVKDVQPGDRVFAFDEDANTMVVAPVRAAAETGTKQTYAVVTRAGTVRASDNHPFLVLEDARREGRQRARYRRVWKTLAELSVGDLVAVSRDLPDFGESILLPSMHHLPRASAIPPKLSNPDLLWLLGYYLGDGSMQDSGRTHRVQFAVPDRDPELRTEIARIVEEQFGLQCKVPDGDRLVVNSRALVDWMHWIQLAGTAFTKRVPAWVFSLPQAERLAFLAGYIDADGYVAPGGQTRVTSVNLAMLDDIADLTRLCGLNPSAAHPISSKHPHDADRVMHAFRMTISGRADRLPLRNPRRIMQFAERWQRGHSYTSAKGKTFRGHTAEHLGFTPVVAIELDDVVGVWDIEVDGPHNFVAEGLVVHNSEVVYHKIREDLEQQGVLFLDTDTGLREHEDVFKEYFCSVIPVGDNKFAALNTATWSGGSFIYVPPGVKVDIPLQAYFRINTENMGQFERTLIIADEGSSVHYVEGCTAPVYSSDSLHSAVVEIVVKKNAHVRYTTIQNWSNNVYNLVTKRTAVQAGGRMEWIDGNLGCLASNQTITTRGGVKFIQDVTAGEEVLAYDEQSGELVFRRVLGKRYSGEQPVREVSVGERRLLVTDNHPFLSPVAGSADGALTYTRADALAHAVVPVTSLDYGEPYKLDVTDLVVEASVELSTGERMHALGECVGGMPVDDTVRAIADRHGFFAGSTVQVPAWVRSIPRAQREAFVGAVLTAAGRDIAVNLPGFADVLISLGQDSDVAPAGTSRDALPTSVETREVQVSEHLETVSTWDIEVEGTGNFVSQGFIVHNSKVTMKYPACYLLGENASGETLSVAFAGPGQHQDAGAKMVHAAPNTSSNIVSKSVARGGGRTSYRGLVEVQEDAHGSKANVRCDALLVDTISRSDTYPTVTVREDDASIGHEATVSKVGEDQLFYLMSRGLSENEAMATIVRGFVEPIARELPMEYALELNRLIELQMEGSVG